MLLFCACIPSLVSAAGDRCAGWAEEGYCELEDYQDFMRRHCASHCAPPLRTDDASAQKEKEQDGQDDPAFCPELKASGYCSSNSDYMLQHCPSTCAPPTAPPLPASKQSGFGQDHASGSGGAAASDAAREASGAAAAGDGDSGADAAEDPQCNDWARLGYCTQGGYVEYMQSRCVQTCTALEASGEVLKLHQEDPVVCSNYVRTKACETHAAYMEQHCAGFCDGSVTLVKEELPPPIGPLSLLAILGGFGYLVYRAAQYALAKDAASMRGQRTAAVQKLVVDADKRSTKKIHKPKRS